MKKKPKIFSISQFLFLGGSLPARFASWYQLAEKKKKAAYATSSFCILGRYPDPQVSVI